MVDRAAVRSPTSAGAVGAAAGLDVLIVSVGATTGWRASTRELQAAFAAAGARVGIIDAGPVAQVRTFMLTDFVQARAARRACRRALTQHDAAAIVYCSMTAALLWPRPGAIWLDAIAAENRPGRHGVWQRVVERQRLVQAPLVMTMAPYALPRRAADAVVVPTPVEASGPAPAVRDVDVLAYAADPVKRRLDLILDAWARARRGGETLVVAGLDRSSAPAGVRFAGRLAPAQYRELVRRARVFVAAPRREDFGIAALEALADGCRLVTTPSPGPYPALRLARELDPRLVADELAPAIRTALDDPAPGYGERASELMAPFSRAAVTATIAGHVLPRLLPAWTP
ncbi:MAG: glycosyltransferase [Solirubrobacteraceae bacterium]